MPIEVVGGDIEQQGDIGPEVPSGIELKTRYLKDDGIGLRAVHEVVEERRADIAADKHLLLCGAQELADQGGDGGLAVGTGNGDHRSLQDRGSQSQFTEDADTAAL